MGGLDWDAGSGSKRWSRDNWAHIKPAHTAARSRPHCREGPTYGHHVHQECEGWYLLCPQPLPLASDQLWGKEPDSLARVGQLPQRACPQPSSPPSSGQDWLDLRPRFAPLLPPFPVTHSPLSFPKKPVTNHLHLNPGSSPGLVPAVRWRWDLFRVISESGRTVAPRTVEEEHGGRNRRAPSKCRWNLNLSP